MTAAQSENALANLRTLLEVNAQMAREDPEDRLESAPNEEVREVLSEVLDSASTQRDRLAVLIAEWESLQRKKRATLVPSVESLLSARDLIESWLAIKEASAELCRSASALAPSARIQRRLEELAREEEILAERLRGLL